MQLDKKMGVTLKTFPHYNEQKLGIQQIVAMLMILGLDLVLLKNVRWWRILYLTKYEMFWLKSQISFMR